MERQHDIVLLGATGFVGRLTARALAMRAARSPDAPLRVALAGRDAVRLGALKDELALTWPVARGFDVLVADATDRVALQRMAESTRVVCTAVGPYSRHGSAVVAACVEAGTHCCDLTGETLWVRRMIDAHHDEAERRGVRIVCGAGFDSVPSDLGVLLLQDEAVRRTGAACDRVRLYMKRSRGGVSGGTIASAIATMQDARDPAQRRVLLDPYALNPHGAHQGVDGRDDFRVRWDDDVDAWTAPFFMGPVNTRVVRRTHALLGSPWGKGFSYEERMSTGRGLRGRARAVGMTVTLGALFGALQLGPSRALLERTVLPAPGEGPSPDVVEHGFFELELVGRWTHEPARAPLRVAVRGEGDPGYGCTSQIFADVALSLAVRGAELPARGGVLTPAVALGLRAVEWLAPALTLRAL